MNKRDLTNDNNNKGYFILHETRKGKSLVEFNVKNIFQILRKFKIYFLLSKSVFCPLQFKRVYSTARNLSAGPKQKEVGK